jgi:hypothetical protein
MPVGMYACARSQGANDGAERDQEEHLDEANGVRAHRCKGGGAAAEE